VHILIVNCGSSSQSFKVYEAHKRNQPEVMISGKARNVATKTTSDAVIEWSIYGQNNKQTTPLPTHTIAAEQIIRILSDNRIEIDAIGHRFVHGGNIFNHTVQIDPTTMQGLAACLPFAPIHNPNSYQVIQTYLHNMPDFPQFAVFDTAFHSNMPEVSRQYALPHSLVEKYGYRKYGFHGLSYQYITSRIPTLLGSAIEELKLIICHLGTGGSSLAAVNHGVPLDTSMGYSPLPGLVMSTRCGDIDAEIVLDMVRNGYSPDEVSAILNNQSGLLGLSGFSSNLSEIIAEAERGNTNCQLAYDVYVHRLKSYIGAYISLLNGADALVFTDDIGMKSWKLREKVLSHTDRMGFDLDIIKNRNAPNESPALISTPASQTQIWIIPTDEESIILQEVMDQL